MKHFVFLHHCILSLFICPSIAPPRIPLTQGMALPRRSFFRRSQFALEKSRGTSRHPAVAVAVPVVTVVGSGDLFAGPERPRCTSVRPGPGLVIRPAGQFFFRFLCLSTSPRVSFSPSPVFLLPPQPLSSVLPCALLSLPLTLPSLQRRHRY